MSEHFSGVLLSIMDYAGLLGVLVDTFFLWRSKVGTTDHVYENCHIRLQQRSSKQYLKEEVPVVIEEFSRTNR